MIDQIFLLDKNISKILSLPPHGIIDYLVLILCVFYTFKYFRKDFLHAIYFLIFFITPMIINFFYFKFYGLPFTLFDIINIKDLYYYEKYISIILVIVLIVYIYIFTKIVNTTILICMLMLIGFGIFNKEKEDWNILKKYHTSGFYSVLLSEPLIKGINLLDFFLIKKDENQFYLNNSNDPKANIYIGLFESLVVPHMLFDEKFNYLSNLSYYSVNNSIFAGESARSEFEILCGVPSLKEYGIEFNYIDYFSIDNNLNCLPNILNKNYGYDTYAINASHPWVFNSDKAYKKIGFNKNYFIKHEFKEYYLKDAPGEMIFDGHFLNFVVNTINENNTIEPNKNKLYYFFGVYGHHPYSRNKKLRPDIVKIEDNEINNIVNQFYYRNIAISEFIKYLEKNDSEAIIVLCGDHLPFINNFKYSNKNISYCYTKNLDKIQNLYDVPKKILGMQEEDLNFKQEYLKLLKGK